MVKPKQEMRRERDKEEKKRQRKVEKKNSEKAVKVVSGLQATEGSSATPALGAVV